jgi:hypothetical protein
VSELSQMPVAGLDDLTPQQMARELRGAVYKAQGHLARAEKRGDPKDIKRARAWLAECMWRARSEKVVPFYSRHAK